MIASFFIFSPVSAPTSCGCDCHKARHRCTSTHPTPVCLYNTSNEWLSRISPSAAWSSTLISSQQCSLFDLFSGGLHRRPRCQERREPQTDAAQPPRQDLDHGGRGRSLGGLQVTHECRTRTIQPKCPPFFSLCCHFKTLAPLLI